MKKRLAIVIVISLVMLLTFALPAFAASPHARAGRAGIIPNDAAESGSGVLVLRVNQDYTLSIIVLLNGAQQDYTYLCTLEFGTTSAYLGDLVTNEDGNGRLVYVTAYDFALGGQLNFSVDLGHYEPGWVWVSHYISSPAISFDFTQL